MAHNAPSGFYENMKTALRIAGLTLVAGGAYLAYKSYKARKLPPKIYYKKTRLWGGYNAHTVPPFGIFIHDSEKNNEALHAHELVHWRQYQERGLLPFYLAYTYHSLTKSYDKNPMEIEARSNETPYCQQNYTECVRTGQAKTVHNPSFRKNKWSSTFCNLAKS